MKATSHIRPGYGTVTPFVIVRGAVEFIDFMQRAFDAEELGRVGEAGAIGHADGRRCRGGRRSMSSASGVHGAGAASASRSCTSRSPSSADAASHA